MGRARGRRVRLHEHGLPVDRARVRCGPAACERRRPPGSRDRDVRGGCARDAPDRPRPRGGRRRGGRVRAGLRLRRPVGHGLGVHARGAGPWREAVPGRGRDRDQRGRRPRHRSRDGPRVLRRARGGERRGRLGRSRRRARRAGHPDHRLAPRHGLRGRPGIRQPADPGGHRQRPRHVLPTGGPGALAHRPRGP